MQANGNRTNSAAVSARPAVPLIGRSSAGSLNYQYVGRTAVTVVSPATGRQYRFDKPGAVQQVDARDRKWLERVPNIKPANRRVG